MESKFHSEDVQNTRSNNKADRTNLQSRVNLSINVFDSDQHPENLLVNVVLGILLSIILSMWRKVLLVDSNSYVILKQTFYIDTTTKIMNASENVFLAGTKRILNQELFYARTLVLIFVNPDFDFEKLWPNELDLFPASLFYKIDVLRTTKQKFKLINDFESWSKF